MAHYYRIFACFIFSFFSITSYASDPLEGREERIKQARIEFSKKVYGMSNSEATKKVTAGLQEGKVKQTATFSGTSSDGSKINASASVTKTADKAKVASTLTDRLKKAKDYAAKTGKASIPAFVGMAAFNGLLEGIDWVMDEGGKVTKYPDEDQIPLNSYPKIWCWDHSTLRGCGSSPSSAGRAYASLFNVTYKSSSIVQPDLQAMITYETSSGQTDRVYVLYGSNKNYDPNSVVEPQEVTPQQLTEALENALQSNNPALAAAIAEAIKAAYSPDNTAGQDSASNTLAASSNEDIKNAITSAANNTGSESTSDGKPGHYKITDGDKTIEGYVTPADTSAQTSTDSESTTVIDPETGNQVTTGTATGSLQLPAFCDWASIVCDWINWTKEEPDEPEELKPVFEEIEVPYTPFSIANFNAQCPPDEQLSLTLMGQETSFVFPMTPFCDFFSAIKPFVIALASFWAVKLIGGGAFNWGN